MQFWHHYLAQSADGRGVPAGLSQMQSEPLPLRVEGRKILVVEDDLDTVHTLVFVLRKIGHTVEYAINGCAALDIARRFQPDFVVLDIGLPGMNGFELCRKLKADPDLRDTRVVALTAYGQEEYRKRSMAAGCEAHLVKPYDARLLAGYFEGSA